MTKKTKKMAITMPITPAVVMAPPCFKVEGSLEPSPGGVEKNKEIHILYAMVRYSLWYFLYKS